MVSQKIRKFLRISGKKSDKKKKEEIRKRLEKQAIWLKQEVEKF